MYLICSRRELNSCLDLGKVHFTTRADIYVERDLNTFNHWTFISVASKTPITVQFDFLIDLIFVLTP